MAPYLGWAAAPAVTCASPYRHRISIHSDMGKIPAPGEWDDPEIDRHIAGETVLVIRARGSAGSKSEHLAALRSLGLNKICSYTYGRTSDRRFWGNVKSAKHMLVVVGRQHTPAGRAVAELEMLDMTVHEYGTEAEPGLTLVLRDGEYLQYEEDGSFKSFSWTTKLDAREFTRRAVSELGAPSVDDGLLAIVDDGSEIEVLEGPSAEIAGLVLSDPHQITYVRLAIGSMTINWQTPKRHAENDMHELATTSLFGNAVSRPNVSRMLARTATNSVARNRKQLLSKLLHEGSLD